MMTVESFRKLFVDLWNWRKTSKVRYQVHIGDLSYNSIPTQADKPSNHSSLTLAEGINLAQLICSKEKGCMWSFVSNTNSMEPKLDDNNIVVLEPLNDARLIKQQLVGGQTVIYHYKNDEKMSIIHRIQAPGPKKKGFYFKGDNNFHSDGYVPVEWCKYRLMVKIYTRQRREGD